MSVFSSNNYHEEVKSKQVCKIQENDVLWKLQENVFMGTAKFTTLQLQTHSCLTFDPLFITVDRQILPTLRHQSELSNLIKFLVFTSPFLKKQNKTPFCACKL